MVRTTLPFFNFFFQKIKKSEVDTDLNATDNIFVEEDTINDKTQESSKGVNSDTSIGNCVDGSVAYNQFKELLICDSLDEVNICTLKLTKLLSLGIMDKGAIASEAKYKSRNERWFNQNQKDPSKDTCA